MITLLGWLSGKVKGNKLVQVQDQRTHLFTKLCNASQFLGNYRSQTRQFIQFCSCLALHFCHMIVSFINTLFALFSFY